MRRTPHARTHQNGSPLHLEASNAADVPIEIGGVKRRHNGISALFGRTYGRTVVVGGDGAGVRSGVDGM